MKNNSQRGIIICITMAIMLAGCRSQPDTGATEREVREFLTAYAEDIRHHRREAIVNRYDRRGIFALGNGGKSFDSFETVKKNYQTDWIGPMSFEWDDVSVEVLSPEAAVVAGRFKWQPPKTEQPQIYSYTGLLVKDSGQWRIRLEDESRR